MVVGLLGILKAGAAYVPVDPEYPEERIASIFQDSEAVLLLAQRRLMSQLPESHVPVLFLDDEGIYAGQPEIDIDKVETGQTSKDLAYVIYTSGSTGKPKGVMNEHRGVVNRIFQMSKDYSLGSRDIMLQKAPYGFDTSVLEIFGSLVSGVKLVMAKPFGHRDADYLIQLINNEGVTICYFVPSMWQVLVDRIRLGQCSSLEKILCAGEDLPARLVGRSSTKLPGASIFNAYGPTEAAVEVTYWACKQEAIDGRIPIGRPIANMRVYILDEQRQPVPLGVAGEIYIAGDGVARGYLNRPELTAERFIPDPFSGRSDARMYRTGDLGRWRPDGVIEYLGRNDFQVKIRGQRIELGEIEARLAELPQVRDAVVMAREDRPATKDW